MEIELNNANFEAEDCRAKDIRLAAERIMK